MQYRRVEKLIIAIGFAAVLGSLALATAGDSVDPIEVLSQAMLLTVLVAATRLGLRGGLLAAILASVAYFGLRVPGLAGEPVSALAALAIASRFAAYGLVGVLGGEMSTRLRYLLADSEESSAVDEWSRVFNQRHALRELRKARGRCARYEETFSVVVITLSASLTAGMRPLRQRSLVRTAAEVLRNDVRTVDEVARLDDGRFLLLLPHTPADGAAVVAGRCGNNLRRALGASTPAVQLEFLGAPRDLARIDLLINTLAEQTDGFCQDSSSGTYSAPAASTSNPAPVSTDSAPASSALSTSTAAVPDGSTKQ